MTEGDIGSWSPAEIRYAINEIFARHGAAFPKKQVRETFEQFNWYHPQPDLNFDQVEATFSDTERLNLHFLAGAEDSKRTSRSADASSVSQEQRFAGVWRGTILNREVGPNGREYPPGQDEIILEVDSNAWTMRSTINGARAPAAKAVTHTANTLTRSEKGYLKEHPELGWVEERWELTPEQNGQSANVTYFLKTAKVGTVRGSGKLMKMP